MARIHRRVEFIASDYALIRTSIHRMAHWRQGMVRWQLESKVPYWSFWV